MYKSNAVVAVLIATQGYCDAETLAKTYTLRYMM